MAAPVGAVFCGEKESRGAAMKKREDAVVASSCIPTPSDGRDFAIGEILSHKRCSDSSRGRENTPPASLGEEVEKENPSLTMPGGGVAQQGELIEERRKNAVMPSSSTPPPSEVRDFDRADAVVMKRCSKSLRGQKHSPSTSIQTHAEKKKPSFAKLSHLRRVFA